MIAMIAMIAVIAVIAVLLQPSGEACMSSL